MEASDQYQQSSKTLHLLKIKATLTNAEKNNKLRKT